MTGWPIVAVALSIVFLAGAYWISRGTPRGRVEDLDAHANHQELPRRELE